MFCENLLRAPLDGPGPGHLLGLSRPHVERIEDKRRESAGIRLVPRAECVPFDGLVRLRGGVEGKTQVRGVNPGPPPPARAIFVQFF